MTDVLNTLILGRFSIFLLLGIAFLVLSHLAIRREREYAGYALGWLLGLFFIVVYVSLGGGASAEPGVRENLFLYEVILATFLGLVVGIVFIVGLRLGTRFTRGKALLAAAAIGLNLVLMFLTIIAGAVVQRMIGIFALALGIAALLAYVLSPTQEPTGGSGSEPASENHSRPTRTRSTLDEIRRRNQR